MIPWFSENHNVARSDMNLMTYLTIAYKQNYVLKKLKLNEDWWKNKDREKWGFNKFGMEIQNKSSVLT